MNETSWKIIEKVLFEWIKGLTVKQRSENKKWEIYVDANTATDGKELFSSVNYILVILANFIHEDKTQQNKENNCLTLKSPISTCVFSLQFSYISYVTWRENLYKH